MIDPADNDGPSGEPVSAAKLSAPAFVRETPPQTAGSVTFLGAYGHELRNHVAPIHNALFLLRRRTHDAESLALLDLIAQQIREVIGSFEHVAEAEDFSRDNVQLDRRVVELEQVIVAAITPLQLKIGERGHRFHLTPRPWRGSLNADAARVAQAVRSAIFLALCRTDDAGDIWVEIETLATDVIIRVRGSPNQFETAGLTGLIARDFELHRAPGGIATDLAVAARIVHLHGGSMAGADIKQPGAMDLEIRLPLSKAPTGCA